MTFELWATETGSAFHLWMRHDGSQIDAEFEYPVTTKEAFGVLRHRGFDVQSLAVHSGNRVIRRGSRPNAHAGKVYAPPESSGNNPKATPDTPTSCGFDNSLESFPGTP